MTISIILILCLIILFIYLTKIQFYDEKNNFEVENMEKTMDTSKDKGKRENWDNGRKPVFIEHKIKIDPRS